MPYAPSHVLWFVQSLPHTFHNRRRDIHPENKPDPPERPQILPLPPPARCISRHGDPMICSVQTRFLPATSPPWVMRSTGVKDLPEIDLFCFSHCGSLHKQLHKPSELPIHSLSAGISIDIIRMISLFSQICKCLFHVSLTWDLSQNTLWISIRSKIRN